MADVEEFVDTFLKHYASPYYDPDKAHEYYLRNRELKGPTSSDLKGKKKKEAFTVAKSNIGIAKKAEAKTIATTKKVEMAKLRSNAKAKQTEVRNSAKQLIANLTENLNAQKVVLATSRDDQLKKIASDTQSKLDALPPLPKTVSKEVRAMRANDIAQIKGEAKAKSGQVLAETKTQELQVKSATSAESKKAQAAAKANAKRVTTELKSSVTNAQTKYKGLRDQLVSKYKAVIQNEHDAIKQNK